MKLLPASLLLLLFSVCGLEAVTKFTSPDFESYPDDEVPWTEAQEICRKNHTDLLTIRNEEEAQYFIDAEGWIGLFRDNSEGAWKWSRGGMTASFFNWGFDDLPREHCAYKRKAEVEWRASECTQLRPFSCFDEKLVLVKENKTWEEALDHCRSLGGRRLRQKSSFKPVYDLPSLITEDDHIYAREKAREASTEEVWTGLRFLAGHWWWVDGEPVHYQDIQTCPTVESCGVLEKNGTSPYKTRDCQERRNFMCYRL